MKEIKTAEELCRIEYDDDRPEHIFMERSVDMKWAIFMMQRFAKMHVEAALESASKEGKIIDEDGDTYHQPHIFHCNGEEYKNWIDKKSILNAYPLNLIK